MANTSPLLLDVCCGSKMLWFDNNNPLAIFNDLRNVDETLCDGREIKIEPDSNYDFRDLPFADNAFKVLVFDPPHLKTLGDNSWLAIKYGKLNESWRDDLKLGFEECFRVLDDNGVLVFKWNETQIKTNEILKLSPYKPMFGHISGKRANTHWVLFIKNSLMEK
ncbi:SAM-dependent methyltransferase [Vibrio parahaemolyticus]|nr:SAM-dependent methyltransferase [Vibrio parahaemolyticus]